MAGASTAAHVRHLRLELVLWSAAEPMAQIRAIRIAILTPDQFLAKLQQSIAAALTHMM